MEHEDRLAWFGVEHLRAALSATGRELVVLDPEETTDDLVGEMTDVLISLCVRLCRQRAAKNRAIAAATAKDTDS